MPTRPQPISRSPTCCPPKRWGGVRLARRRRLREIVEQTVDRFEKSQNEPFSDFEAAFRIMTSKQARAPAFELSQETGGRPATVTAAIVLARCCLMARRLIEAGVRFVTINTFLTVFDEITWDIHGIKPFTSIEGMRDIVAPMYDQAMARTSRDLNGRGMLDNTLVAISPSSAARRG